MEIDPGMKTVDRALRPWDRSGVDGVDLVIRTQRFANGVDRGASVKEIVEDKRVPTPSVGDGRVDAEPALQCGVLRLAVVQVLELWATLGRGRLDDDVVEHWRFRQFTEFVGDLIDRLARTHRGGRHRDNQADLAEQRQQGLLHLRCERLHLIPIGSIFNLV